ncbi:hypothetical protein CDV36_015764 [Fusarium kuroshium]|uniref:Chromo domain-containing protein n=1 Tax=Fusarium kuroshium TaxID=2010991 RepID=A0A3M2R8Q6_9HYPO|nr:hypothetical protein CDV36_015764 [Fusarium kuroshium]
MAKQKRKAKPKGDIFIVDSIQRHVVDRNGNTKFLVKWRGYEDVKDWTWEPIENLRLCGEEMIRDYFDRLDERSSAASLLRAVRGIVMMKKTQHDT